MVSGSPSETRPRKSRAMRGYGKNLLESDHVVTGLDGSHTLADRLDNTGTLVAQDDGKSTLGILAGQGVGI